MCADREQALLPIAARATREALHRWPGMQVERDDVMSDAMLGVTQAWLRYDPHRGVEFEGWALRRARGAIVDGIRARSTLSRGEVASGITIDDLPLQRHPPSPIDVQVDGQVIALPLPDPVAARRLEQIEARCVVVKALRLLPARHRLVVTAVYLLDWPQVDVARDIGMTQSRVSQLLREAIGMMRRSVA